MGTMGDLISSGRIVDAILALMVLEGIVLAVVRQRTGRGPSIASLVPNFAAGGCLLMALRAALTGATVPLVAGWLFAALLSHLADLWSRWR
jgi:hypothetical protein